MATSTFACRAWNNGSWLRSGAGYGIKIPKRERDAIFNPAWKNVILEFPRGNVPQKATVNIAKKSFWTDACRELICKEIGLWLISKGLAPWPKGKPPVLCVEVVRDNHFRVTHAKAV